MIKIDKGREPPALTEYRMKPFATYADMPQTVRLAIISKLIQEQGGLCAYCMRRIPQKSGTPAVSIEHWEPQSITNSEKALEYGNMLAVCSGNRGCGSKSDMTCDARRGNSPLTVNPLNAATLSSIRYKADGTIFSDDPVINSDLNDTLNLNCASVGLVESRRRTLQAMLKQIQKKHATGDIRLCCERLLRRYQQASIKTPYLGILIWWLEKKVQR